MILFQVIIDIEWGAFGDNGVLDFIRTEFDREVDQSSLLVNSFTFEKYLAGKYLGEIVRVVLLHLASLGLIFGGKASAKLLAQDSFTSAHLSQVEE
jgi:hexokinase